MASPGAEPGCRVAKPYKSGFGPFAPEVYKLAAPYCYRCAWGASYPGCARHCLDQVPSYFKDSADPDQVACLIVEPVMGEGGSIMPPQEYFRGLREILGEKGIVFIMDEIQTGFCRTGKLSASERLGIAPDLLPCAKSIAAGLAAIDYYLETRLREQAMAINGQVLMDILAQASVTVLG